MFESLMAGATSLLIFIWVVRSVIKWSKGSKAVTPSYGTKQTSDSGDIFFTIFWFFFAAFMFFIGILFIANVNNPNNAFGGTWSIILGSAAWLSAILLIVLYVYHQRSKQN